MAFKNRKNLIRAIEICRSIWANREEFDRNERSYKLQVAERIEAALAAVGNGGEYLPLLKRAFQRPNNLTSHRVHGPFLRWAEEHQDSARMALGHFVSGGDWHLAPKEGPERRIDGFLHALPNNIVQGPGNRLSLASFFLFGFAPEKYPVYRTTAVEPVERLLGYAEPASGSTMGELYRHHLTFFREFGEVLRNADIAVRDILDVQSFVWILGKSDQPEVRTWRGDQNLRTESDMNDQLAELVDRFRSETGYPTRGDETDQRARQDFEEYLTEQLESDSPNWRTLQTIVSSHAYGSPGPQSGLNRYINNAAEEESKKLQQTLHYLLKGDAPLSRRLDEVLGGEHKISGLGESGALKLLAIMHPETVIPVFPFRGPKGKATLMAHPALDLLPPAKGTAGELAARSNDLLRKRLAPHFRTDTHGMKRFLYWLADQGKSGGPKLLPGSDLGQLADDLLLDQEYLADIIDMLRERKQIILYGPPGTGKTYLARALMEHLAPAPTRYKVVQFHPSYSYEDFVQGYRPMLGDDGQLGYQLKSGPLMRLAQAAEEDPEHEYVLLIDEINRGNLPKIFGELLYLLEYRDSSVTPMYGEEGEEFSLPGNLLIIGTMNTADRSIALVDAALRRRFHFAPLFPGEGPLAGFLERWLTRNRPEMMHVAGLVSRLNRELKDRLNVHQQVGHSYFTRHDLSEKTLERVWKYDITPFLEDQLFGQERELARFTLEALKGQADADDHLAGAPDGDVHAQLN
jgi:hypothetical protein